MQNTFINRTWPRRRTWLTRAAGMSWSRRSRVPALAVVLAVLSSVMSVAGTSSARAAPARPAEDGTASATVRPQSRAASLGPGWRTSSDRLWTTAGDASGFRVLVADARTGYTWRAVATLSEPGIDTDQWIGNACVTSSGQRAVVVYAPRTFTNKAQLTRRGGSTAVVDLATGAVRKLPIHTSLAYFNPGCGAGEVATLTQEGDEDLHRTGLLTVHADTGAMSRRVEVPGQLTSAVPTERGIVAAAGSAVVRVGTDGRTTRIATATGVPYQLRPDAGGGVVFLDDEGGTSRVHRAIVTSPVGPAARPAPAEVLATAPRGTVGLRAVAAGRVIITGTARPTGALPATVTTLGVPAAAEVSTRGEAAVTGVRTSPRPVAAGHRPDPSVAQLVHIDATSTRTGARLDFTVDPARTSTGAAPVPAATRAATPLAGETTDPARVCAVPRNDTSFQVMQPKPKQVEWAVDQAVVGVLRVTRPAGWHGNTIGAYTPQGMFTPVSLRNFPSSHVPAQIMLGILGQESNLWQAGRYALPGDYGNPLIGNYYGLEIYNDTSADDWEIRWNEADCGYGVGQLTDGMRAAGHERPGETALPWEKQVAIATDYAANVAASLQLLVGKWNQLSAAGLVLNNGNPNRLENWFYATWAYNSGYHPPGEANSNGAHGLGWLNNPANPRYEPNRHNFGSDPHDFAHPQRWPYPEKVLGFASNPPSGFEAPGTEVPFFRAASWNGGSGDETIPGSALYNKKQAFPPVSQFCADANDCRWGQAFTPTDPDVVGEPAGPCAHRNTAGQYDLKCWAHSSTTWRADCDSWCGREFIRYDPGLAEPADGVSYPPVCNANSLNTSALVIDDVPTSTRPIRDPSCNALPQNSGSLSFTFGHDAAGNESGKIDLHQAGGGLGSHFWFSHTRPNTAEGQKTQITGTWTFPRLDGYAEVLVHIPNHGGTFGTATYVINTAGGPRSVLLRPSGDSNHWVSLGRFAFYGQPKVELSTISATGDGTEKVVWDAAAIQQAYDAGGNRDVRSIYNAPSNTAPMLRENSPVAGTLVQMRTGPGVWTVNSWFFVPQRPDDVNRDGPLLIMDRASGLCLAVAGNRTDAGAPIIVDNCDSSNPSQLWNIDPREPPNHYAVSRMVFNQRSAYCLKMRNGSTLPDTQLEQNSCDIADLSTIWHLDQISGP